MSTSSYVLISNRVTVLTSGNFGEWFSDLSVQSLTSFIAVLTVLILIIGFITLCVMLNVNGKLKSKKTMSTGGNGPETLNEGNQNLIADSELVAVITAAIYASMGDQVPSSGLVVRSIHKVNTRNR